MRTEVLWRRLDQPAVDRAIIIRDGRGATIRGAVKGVLSDWRAYAAEYVVEYDRDWLVRTSCVVGRVGRTFVRHQLRRSEANVWTGPSGLVHEQLEGCTNLVFGFSPVGHIAPLRHRSLATGEAASVRSVSLALPDLDARPTVHRYLCLDPSRLLWESTASDLPVVLDLNDRGIVVREGSVWESVVVEREYAIPASEEFAEHIAQQSGRCG